MNFLEQFFNFIFKIFNFNKKSSIDTHQTAQKEQNRQIETIKNKTTKNNTSNEEKIQTNIKQEDTKTIEKNDYHIKAVFVQNKDMYNINFDTLKQKKYNTIFLAHISIQKRSTEEVKKYIQKANKYGLKVYIWYTTYYNGENIVPANTKEATDRINTVISYGKIKEVSGVILDYCRYNSKIHNDTIMKTITSNIEKVKKGTCKPIGVCTMFENIETLKSYYHQDIKNWNCDYILPMSYKYNYGYSDSTMTRLGNSFKENINCKLVPIFQNYYGDDNVCDIGLSQLTHDISLIKSDSYAIFRYGTGTI